VGILAARQFLINDNSDVCSRKYKRGQRAFTPCHTDVAIGRGIYSDCKHGLAVRAVHFEANYRRKHLSVPQHIF
jgi:hypothetical protein